jgi:hypothetical protein
MAIHCPFHVIVLPYDPVNGLFVEAVHVHPSELTAIPTVLSEFVPTAHHCNPFQATA